MKRREGEGGGGRGREGEGGGGRDEEEGGREGGMKRREGGRNEEGGWKVFTFAVVAVVMYPSLEQSQGAWGGGGQEVS